MVNFTNDPMNQELPTVVTRNSPNDAFNRVGGRMLSFERHVQAAAGAILMNSIRVHGTVEIDDAYAEIMEVTTLTNLTGLYFDLYDGTTAVEITSSTGGASLSGAPVGSLIIKNKDASNVLTTLISDQARVLEADTSKKTHLPFLVTAKNGVDTRIRMHGNTTDDPVDFKMMFYIVYHPKDGGYLEDTLA